MNKSVWNEDEMKQVDQKMLNELKGEYMDIKIPEHSLSEMQKRMEDAKRDKRIHKRQKWVRCISTAAAVALVLFILPNTNAGIAHAMDSMPLLGGLFQVITIREYHYEDETHLITAQVPKIQSGVDEAQGAAAEAGEMDSGKGAMGYAAMEGLQSENQDGISAMSIREKQETVKALNAEITEYVDVLLKEFEKDMVEGAYHSLEIDYTTITDTDNWFTIEICAFETVASGYEFRKYYHIDKTTGKEADIMSLLQDEEGLQAVSEEILRQMQEQMELDGAFYFIKSKDEPDGFETISEDQNFYFNEEGKLVIVFDEYEVASGSSGCLEFVIPDEVWRP